MATQVQFRGGTTTEHSTFTGAAREVTVDTDKDTLVIHDGATAGGFPLALENGPLKNAGNIKLATTSTGIDVTGTVTADGLTVDGDVVINNGTLFGDEHLYAGFDGTSYTSGEQVIRAYAGASGSWAHIQGRNVADTDSVFEAKVAGTTHSLISARGYIYLGGGGAPASTTQTGHILDTTANATYALTINDSGTPYPQGIAVVYTAASPDNNVHSFLQFIDATTTRFRVYSDGDVQNHDNSYGAISDIKVKTDIQDATPKLDDFLKLQWKKFKMKSDVEQYGDDADYRFGLIAQEVEGVWPRVIKESPDTVERTRDLVDEEGNIVYETETVNVLVAKAVEEVLDEDGNVAIEAQEAIYEQQEQATDIPQTETYQHDLGTTTKGIKYSVIDMFTAKALQEFVLEQRAEIIDLKTRLAALEAS